MKATRWIGLVVAAVVVGVIVGALLLRTGDDGSGGAEPLPPLRGQSISVHATMEPRTHLFLEPVTAGLDLVFDGRVVREGTIRVTTGFAPYRNGAPSVERSRSGDLVRIRYRWPLECVTAACLPQEGGSSVFEFSLGRLDFVVVGVGRSAQPVEWPSIEAVSRVGALDVERAAWRGATARPPDVSYRVTPGMLGGVLLGVSALLFAAVAALAWQLVPRRTRAVVVETEAERRVSAIERALALAVAASKNGGTPEQRKALERLARELGDEGLATLTVRARRLAWSPEPPQRSEVEALAEDVRREARADA